MRQFGEVVLSGGTQDMFDFDSWIKHANCRANMHSAMF